MSYLNLLTPALAVPQMIRFGECHLFASGTAGRCWAFGRPAESGIVCDFGV